MSKLSNFKALDIIFAALRAYKSAEIDDVVSYGEIDAKGRRKNDEVILTLDDGKEKRDYVIRAKDITEAERNEA